jgi:hypothetical protein
MRFILGFIFGIVAANIGLTPMAQALDRLIVTSEAAIQQAAKPQGK